MFEHIADFTAWPILTGILVGYVANRIMSGEGKGCCMNLIIGIIGSYVGTFISHLLNIADESHYKEVLSLVGKAKQTVWIGTADIKDLYVDDKPFLALIASLLKKGVEVRLIHAKEPGTAWQVLQGLRPT